MITLIDIQHAQPQWLPETLMTTRQRCESIQYSDEMTLRCAFICGFADSRRRSGGMGTMRRGMLMTILQQYALDQPVWKGKSGER